MALGAARDRAAALAHESLTILWGRWADLPGAPRTYARLLVVRAVRRSRADSRCTGSAAPARADAARGRPDRPRAAARPAGSRPGGDPRRSASRGDRAAPADRGRRRADGGGRGCAGAARATSTAARSRRRTTTWWPASRTGWTSTPGWRSSRPPTPRAPPRCCPGRPRRRTAGRTCTCRTSWSSQAMAGDRDAVARLLEVIRPLVARYCRGRLGTRRPLVPLRGRRRAGGVPGRPHRAAQLPRAGQAVPRVRLRDRGAQGDRRAPGGQPRPDRPRRGRPGLGRGRRRPRAAGVARRAVGAAAGPARRAAREAARDSRAAHRRGAVGGGDRGDRRCQPGRGPGRPAPGAGAAAQERPARPRQVLARHLAWRPASWPGCGHWDTGGVHERVEGTR